MIYNEPISDVSESISWVELSITSMLSAIVSISVSSMKKSKKYKNKQNVIKAETQFAISEPIANRDWSVHSAIIANASDINKTHAPIIK